MSEAMKNTIAFSNVWAGKYIVVNLFKPFFHNHRLQILLFYHSFYNKEGFFINFRFEEFIYIELMYKNCKYYSSGKMFCGYIYNRGNRVGGGAQQS